MNNYLRHFPEFESSDMPTFEALRTPLGTTTHAHRSSANSSTGFLSEYGLSIKILSNGIFWKSDSLST
jgi:hypothetical protein